MLRKEYKIKKLWIEIVTKLIGILIVILLIFQIQEKIYFMQIEKGNFIEEFRQLNFTEETIAYLKKIGENEQTEKQIQCLTASMIENRFILNEMGQLKNRGKREFFDGERVFKQLENQYKAIFYDLEYFPIGKDSSGEESCAYENSWYGARNYGGERVHEGTDIMTSNNIRGYFPIYSMTDGIVEKLGWLKLGGWRIGIRAPSGGYFYYAHLYQYANGLKEGSKVKAGQLIGYVGDSGYSEIEGTVGKFDVHLHLGIYIDDKGQEISVNPYWVLKFLEDRKIQFSR